MENLIETLFESLDIEYAPDDDSPVIVVDDELAFYFIERDDAVEIVCPLAPLGRDAPTLEALLCANYEEGNRVVMAASRAGQCLLAHTRVPRDAGPDGLYEGFDAIVAQARKWHDVLYHGQSI
jgi:hypothetical protein